MPGLPGYAHPTVSPILELQGRPAAAAAAAMDVAESAVFEVLRSHASPRAEHAVSQLALSGPSTHPAPDGGAGGGTDAEEGNVKLSHTTYWAHDVWQCEGTLAQADGSGGGDGGGAVLDGGGASAEAPLTPGHAIPNGARRAAIS
jgi:hypothetical protein